jgi:hypothetical protein
VIEEPDDHLGVEVGDVEVRGGRSGAFGSEGDQQFERVAVGSDRVSDWPGVAGSTGQLIWAVSYFDLKNPSGG